MAITYGFFAALAGSDPADRSYTDVIEAEFERWRFGHNGVVYGIGTNMVVTATGTPDMYVHVSSGAAIAQGLYWLKSTATKDLLIPDADPDNPRVDNVVVRYRLTGNTYRDAILAVVAGTPAASPAAPTPTTTSDVYEIVLAQVTVDAAATTIVTGKITAAGSQPVCGWHSPSLVKMYFDGSANLNAGAVQIKNLADPTADQDAATKASVAAQISAASFAPLANPDFTGVPTAPTATPSTSTTQIATTAYVHQIIGRGSYAGNDSQNRAIPHGLGVVPAFVHIWGTSGTAITNVIMGFMKSTTEWDVAGEIGADITVTEATTTNFYVGGAAANYVLNTSGRVYYWVAYG